MISRLRGPVAVSALVLGLAACTSGEEGGASPQGRTLTVYAAASLDPAFARLAERFESRYDDVEVALSFAGSTDLATQIQEGAQADVFASADWATMERLIADDLVGATPQDFATNTLEIAVPPGNPAGVESLRDLTGDLELVVCAPAVPCGAAAQGAAEAAGLDLSPVSEEQSVTDVLAKVTSGEADAGLVYVTDVQAAGTAVEGIDFPEAAEVVNTYPIAPIAGSDEEQLATEFVDLAVGRTGRSILREAGFGAP